MISPIDVWKALCDEVATALTPAGGTAPEVIRTYDAQSYFSGVTERKIMVVLTGQSRDQINSKKIWDTYDFSIILLEPILEQDEAAQTAHLDGLLTLIPTLGDHFSLKTIVKNGVEMVFTEQAVTIGNRPFELDVLTDHHFFSFEMGLTVRVPRYL